MHEWVRVRVRFFLVLSKRLPYFIPTRLVIHLGSIGVRRLCHNGGRSMVGAPSHNG